MLGIIVVVSVVIALSTKLFGESSEVQSAPQQVENLDEKRRSQTE